MSQTGYEASSIVEAYRQRTVGSDKVCLEIGKFGPCGYTVLSGLSLLDERLQFRFHLGRGQLGRLGRLDFFDEGFEGVWLVHRKLRKGLTIHLDAELL